MSPYKKSVRLLMNFKSKAGQRLYFISIQRICVPSTLLGSQLSSVMARAAGRVRYQLISLITCHLCPPRHFVPFELVVFSWWCVRSVVPFLSVSRLISSSKSSITHLMEAIAQGGAVVHRVRDLSERCHSMILFVSNCSCCFDDNSC